VATARAALQNALVRMIIPMRREFGLAMDMQQMQHDIGYAQSIVNQALTSGTPQLRECAELVERYLQAARSRAAASPPPRAPDTRSLAIQAARRLIDEVGPRGEPLAIRIERAADQSSLRAVLRDATQFIAHLRGGAAAAAFEQHFSPSLAFETPADAGRTPRPDTLQRVAAAAAQELLASLGPVGKPLATRIEHAPDGETLAALIDEAHRTLAALLGPGAADDFQRRLPASLH